MVSGRRLEHRSGLPDSLLLQRGRRLGHQIYSRRHPDEVFLRRCGHGLRCCLQCLFHGSLRAADLHADLCTGHCGGGGTGRAEGHRAILQVDDAATLRADSGAGGPFGLPERRCYRLQLPFPSRFLQDYLRYADCGAGPVLLLDVAGYGCHHHLRFVCQEERQYPEPLPHYRLARYSLRPAGGLRHHAGRLLVRRAAQPGPGPGLRDAALYLYEHAAG